MCLHSTFLPLGPALLLRFPLFHSLIFIRNMKSMERAAIAICTIPFLFWSATVLSQTFELRLDEERAGLQVIKAGVEHPVITQNAKGGMRPYLHPIRTPDGKGVVTEIHPSHHLHQTGVYWGLKKVNGRDFFMNHGGDYYRFKSLSIVEKTGEEVAWETIFDLLDEKGEGILRETQRWTLKEEEGCFLLDLEWQGEGLTDVTVEKFFVGGLFLRMPWVKGISGTAINSIGEKGSAEAEGHRAVWVDVGMELPGIGDWGHIAVLDHPDNVAFPTPWRIDSQLGVGPSRQILGDWQLEKVGTTVERYRLVVYTGETDREKVSRFWKDYVCESRH